MLKQLDAAKSPVPPRVLTRFVLKYTLRAAHLELGGALVHESELARNEPDSQVHHLPRAYDDGLPSAAIRLRM